MSKVIQNRHPFVKSCFTVYRNNKVLDWSCQNELLRYIIKNAGFYDDLQK